MAEKGKTRRGKSYCAAGGPNSENCDNNSHTPGISMHYFPKDETLRQKWTRFVRIHRKDFVPKSYSSLCSAHFDESCFCLMGITVYDDDGNVVKPPRRSLIPGSIPTKDTVKPSQPYASPPTSRKRRTIMRDLLFDYNATVASKRRKLLVTSTPCSSTSALDDTPSPSVASASSDTPCPTSSSALDDTPSPSLASASSDTPCPTSSSALDDTPCSSNTTALDDTPCTAALNDTCSSSTAVLDGTSYNNALSSANPQSGNCGKCAKDKNKRKALSKKHKRLQKKYKSLAEKFKKLQNVQGNATSIRQVEADAEQEDPEEKAEEEEEENLEEQVLASESDHEEETDWASLEESADEYSDEDLNDNSRSNTIRVEPGTPAHEEPKFIVFFSKLLALFSMFCFRCKRGEPTVTMKQRGTMVIVKQHCEKCGENSFEWKSQPMALGGRYPAGNILLSFAILMAGASISKVLLVFRHMGLSTYSARTYFFHQKNFLFPVVMSYWEKYQGELISKLKQVKSVVWSGDGRFDSMGHSAKFGAYTMFCNTVLKVVHFEILQANETGGSSPMELEGAKRAFSFLQSAGLSIGVFISDRHRRIAKWIRECQAGCSHYFDIWHVARSIGKGMLKLGKEKGCERIMEWVKGARNHLYWCATSTKQGFEELIAAKWKSFMQHVANKHDNHPSPLYKKCAHEDQIDNRRWIKIGTKAYDKLHNLLMNVRLVNDIKKLSADSQTSCLEGFHSTLNHWHPKMVCFSWLGTFCRHILASLHFNENVLRQNQTTEDGQEQFKVTYPKFKLGEEVVREVAVPPTYGYVQKIKKELFSITTKSQLKGVTEKYSAKVPSSLTYQFAERVNKSDAVKSYKERNERKATNLYPSGKEQEALQSQAKNTETPARKRKQAKCRTCGKLMKGHNASICRAENSNNL